MNEIMGFLGICRRAGKLSCGHDAVKETVTKSTAQLVFLSSDSSERMLREMSYLCSCDGRDIPVIRTGFTMADFAAGIGRKSGVFSVTDSGFATKLQQKFGEELDDTKI